MKFMSAAPFFLQKMEKSNSLFGRWCTSLQPLEVEVFANIFYFILMVEREYLKPKGTTRPYYFEHPFSVVNLNPAHPFK